MIENYLHDVSFIRSVMRISLDAHEVYRSPVEMPQGRTVVLTGFSDGNWSRISLAGQ